MVFNSAFSILNFARYARQDRRDDLVADRAEPFGHLVGADRLIALPADQHHWVAAPHAGDRAHVDQRIVHAYPAYHRCALATHQHLAPGRRTAKAIGVADWD